MTKKGGSKTARGGSGVGGRAGGSHEGAGGLFSSLIGAGGAGDSGLEGVSSLSAGGTAAENIGFPLGAGRGAAPSPELLAHVFGAGAAEAGLGPAAAAAVAPDDGVDKSRWHIIYPAYLDKQKSVAGGRRVALGIAVQEPRVEEMKKICDHLQVPAAIEYWKRYPRDWLFCRGRLRVQFKNMSDHSLYNPEVPNKKVLMRRMCELIPQLKTRSAAGGAPGRGAASSSSSAKKKKK